MECVRLVSSSHLGGNCGRLRFGRRDLEILAERGDRVLGVGLGVEDAVEPELPERLPGLLEVVLADGEVAADVADRVDARVLENAVESLAVLLGVAVERGDEYSACVVGFGGLRELLLRV